MKASPWLPPDCLLNRLDPDDRDALLVAGVARRYRAGAVIVREGDEGDSVYVLLAGRVKISVTTEDGHEIVLCVLGPGELLGEFESLDEGRPRTASNVALEAVECRVLRGAEFRASLQARSAAAMVLLGTYVRRIRHSDRRRSDVVGFDTNHRVARLLLEQVSGRAATNDGEIDVDLPLTQHELAGLAAASRESVVRALGTLRSRGLIATAPRRITVRDVNGLRKYAG